MPLIKLLPLHRHSLSLLTPSHRPPSSFLVSPADLKLKTNTSKKRFGTNQRLRSYSPVPISATSAPLDLTEDNIKQVLDDARTEASFSYVLAQLFDASVNITEENVRTGKAELVELDGPYVKISLSGRFWHKRSTVLARLGNYLKQRIPEILEVDIEDEKQLDDSPENF
ncbi:alkyl hydroperoxide reductase subunit F [Striga asiatica]|uniref:Alkyl hydroperoxide reductase subunit F n=1 Tax=Striga asiatica TaxID=4170 RepID=A0A5A7P8M3_STRAF|nr:alkyl hydroperoxide reductase subunit F [Striga asiatica]